ncbi:hypothetical protein Cantr_01963 [Candida viswanathii]|uniref:Uncharacterized protein n=1 Tax=Candida viswanathii TaxID=5486 RepID=A0A367YK30_9ASCO|nr:hypothetical protein Cantr_01963 [Candida viswanathii]
MHLSGPLVELLSDSSSEEDSTSPAGDTETSVLSTELAWHGYNTSYVPPPGATTQTTLLLTESVISQSLGGPGTIGIMDNNAPTEQNPPSDQIETALESLQPEQSPPELETPSTTEIPPGEQTTSVSQNLPTTEKVNVSQDYPTTIAPPIEQFTPPGSPESPDNQSSPEGQGSALPEGSQGEQTTSVSPTTQVTLSSDSPVVPDDSSPQGSAIPDDSSPQGTTVPDGSNPEGTAVSVNSPDGSPSSQGTAAEQVPPISQESPHPASAVPGSPAITDGGGGGAPGVPESVDGSTPVYETEPTTGESELEAPISGSVPTLITQGNGDTTLVSQSLPQVTTPTISVTYEGAASGACHSIWLVSFCCLILLLA